MVRQILAAAGQRCRSSIYQRQSSSIPRRGPALAARLPAHARAFPARELARSAWTNVADRREVAVPTTASRAEPEAMRGPAASPEVESSPAGVVARRAAGGRSTRRELE